MLPRLDLYYTDPAQRLTTTGEELDDLDHDLSHLSVRGVKLFDTFVTQLSTVQPEPMRLIQHVLIIC